MDPIRLLFNSSNHLLVTSSDDGSYTLAQVEPEGRNWHVLSELQSAKGRQSILCALVFEECNVTGEWYTIDRLGDLTLSGDLRQVLQAIDEQLYRIPYLGMGENEYIYRFRTTKERNRSVYIDGQSEALYQSALCLAIKEARRTKEKSSGEPAVLDFGAVSYVIPSHFGFCLGVQNLCRETWA